MIRINLLSVEKPIAATASSGPKISLNLSDKAGPIAALFVLAGCAGYIALDYLNLQRQDSALHQELIAARAEKARLQPILREVERFEAQKRDLQQRVNLIEELTNMMLAQRGYEMNAKVIQAADEMLGIANNLRG